MDTRQGGPRKEGGPLRVSYPRAIAVGLCLAGAASVTVVSAILHQRLHTETGLTRTIYANADFDGDPVLRDTATAIDLGFLDTHPDQPRRFFSARWTGVWFLREAQAVDVHLGGDDRVAIWIDGALLLERNVETGLHTVARRRELAAGFHDVRLDYVQRGGDYRLNVQWAPADERARVFDPEALFPAPPSARQITVNRRLLLLRCVVVAAWLAPPILVLLLVGLPAAFRRASRTARGRELMYGSTVFLVGFTGYLINALHFEPLVFVRQQNVIFSADTWTTIGSMGELTFREHIRQHPLFSLVTSSMVQVVQRLSPAGINRSILMTLALIAATNCTLAYVILRRVVSTAWLAAWFTGLYVLLFVNLAIFSIPETYALSTSVVLLYLMVATGARTPIDGRTLATLTLLAGLAGLFNPPLLSLSVVHLVLLAHARGARATAAPAMISLAALALVFVLANLIIFGPEFYTNFTGDDERYGAWRHFGSWSSVGTVLSGFFLFAVLAPVGQLTHHLALADVTRYFDTLSGTSRGRSSSGASAPDERYGAWRHFGSWSSVGTVLSGFFLFAVLAPVGQLTHHHGPGRPGTGRRDTVLRHALRQPRASRLRGLYAGRRPAPPPPTIEPIRSCWG